MTTTQSKVQDLRQGADTVAYGAVNSVESLGGGRFRVSFDSNTVRTFAGELLLKVWS